MRRVRIACLCLCASAALLRAQASVAVAEPVRQAGPAKATPARPTDHLAVYVYDRERSRVMFAACDGNGDDRLDLFESRMALADLGDPSNPGWFRRLDTDRDGFLDWPEFDRFYHDLVRGGGTLSLKLVRPVPEAPIVPVATGDAAPRRTIDLFDVDHDGSLDIDETEAMLRGLGLPPNLVSMAPMLDRNHDRKLGPDELAPAMQQFHIDLFAPVAAPPDKKPTTTTTTLGEPWATADADHSQAIERIELAAALRRIDPQLARWTDRVLAAADRNGNGRLDPGELPSAAAAAAAAPAETVAERPAKR
jgi:Ca2+-binding EF-hand superfamily protein